MLLYLFCILLSPGYGQIPNKSTGTIQESQITSIKALMFNPQTGALSFKLPLADMGYFESWPLYLSYSQNNYLEAMHGKVELGASGLIIDFVYPYTKSNRLSSAA
ncbi:MAG: hypothetical protein ACO2ZM_05515 [Francisellaceae bacterium]